MHVELSVALNFIISHLYNRLPRRRVDVFAEELENGFRIRFQGHWYPEEPSKGSGFRCVKIAEDKVDPVVDAAARSSGLDITEIKSYLPSGLTVWIDPNEVSYRVGEYGHVQILYRRQPGSTNCSAADGGLIDDVSSGFDNGAPSSSWTGSSGGGFSSEHNLLAAAAAPGLALKLNPIGTTFNGNGDHSPLAGGSPGWPATASPVGTIGSLQGPNSLSMTSFTAATFAQTKFGSTKMKSHGATRPSRLSPTSAAISVAAVGADGCVTAPRISPTGPNPALVSNRGRWNHSPTAVMAQSPADRLSPMQQSSMQPGSTYAAQLSLAAAAAAAAPTVGGCSYKGSQGLFDGNGLQDWMMIKHPSHQQQQQPQQRQQQQLHQYLMHATAAASAPHLNQTLLAGSSSAFGGGGYQSTGSCVPQYFIGQTTPQPFYQADLSSKMTTNSLGIGFGGDLPSGAMTSSTSSSVGHLFPPINASAFAEATGNGGFGSEASGGSIAMETASLLGDDAISPLAANISQVDWSFVSSAVGTATIGNGASGSHMSVGNDGSGVGMVELHKLLLVN